MADLTKLKPQERQILLIVGPSSVVWRFDDLSQELLNHGIKTLSDPVDLIDYFDKRPTLFTVVNNHVWSKVAPRKMPTSPPAKQTQNQVPFEKPTQNSNFSNKLEVTESEKPEISDNIKTNKFDSNLKNDAQLEKNALTKIEQKKDFQSRVVFSKSYNNPSSTSSRSTYVPPPRFLASEKKNNYERFSTEKKNYSEKYPAERFSTEKKNYSEKYPAEKAYTPRWNSILMPNNAVFNPVANLIHNCPHTPENSVRVCVESRRHVMYKIDWVYSKLPSHVKKNWKSAKELLDDLFYEQDFLIGPHCCHMRAALQRSPHPDKVAKIIVDKLLDQKGSISSKDLHNDLPTKIKLYLKTAKGLKGFVQFFPALFQSHDQNRPSEKGHDQNQTSASNDDQVELMTVPIFKSEKDLKLPYGSDPKKAEDSHQMVINSVLNLMKMSHMDAQNSTVFVFANVDKPYFRLEWIFEKLPKNIKAKFDCYKSLKMFLFRNSRTFLIIGGFIQLRTKLVDVPCDKSISLEIQRIQHRLSSPSIQDVFQRLPSYCTSRVRSVGELQKFLGAYPEFHGKPDLPYQPSSHGAASKTSNSADLHQNTIPKTPNLQESLQQMSQQLQDLQLKNGSIPEELKKDINTLADQFKMISMSSSHSNSSNSLQDPAVISYTKKETEKNSSIEFMDMAPIETLDQNDAITEI